VLKAQWKSPLTNECAMIAPHGIVVAQFQPSLRDGKRLKEKVFVV